MFEQFFVRLLSAFLSRYFTHDGSPHDGSVCPPSSSKTKDSHAPALDSSFQTSVWSGFVTLRSLAGRLDVLSPLFKKAVCAAAGLDTQPLELRHLTVERVEISVPWSSLSSKVRV